MKSSNLLFHELRFEMNRMIKSLDWMRTQNWMQSNYGYSDFLDDEILSLRVRANQTLIKTKNSQFEKESEFLPFLQEESALMKFRFCSILHRFNGSSLLDGVVDATNFFSKTYVFVT